MFDDIEGPKILDGKHDLWIIQEQFLLCIKHILLVLKPFIIIDIQILIKVIWTNPFLENRLTRDKAEPESLTSRQGYHI